MASELRRLVGSAIGMAASAFVDTAGRELEASSSRTGACGRPRCAARACAACRRCVTIDGKPGVFFLSLDAASVISVMGASAWYALPYFFADATIRKSAAGVRFTSERKHPGARPAAFAATYRPTGAVAPPAPRTLAWRLPERYCVYTADGGTIARAEIHHPPWPLQQADAAIRRNTLGEAAGLELAGAPDLVHFAARVDAVGWAPVPLRPAA